METNEKLDQLAEFQSQRDSIEIEKRALLDEVKIPSEVEEIVAEGMKKMSEVEETFYPTLELLKEKTEKKLALIVVPDEIKTALAEIDRQRAEIIEHQTKNEAEIAQCIRAVKAEIQANVEAKTKDIYAAIAQRKAEIEVEFSGKAEAVDENIKKLTEEIKSDVLTMGVSVKGKYYQGIYVKGRVTWDTSKMDGYAVGHPEVLFMRKEGDPSCTIRKI
jgi:chromosome segregation ATPase